MPLADTPADHIGTLLLAASGWKISLPKMKVKRWKPYLPIICFPWCNTFLGKVEAHAVTPFWRTLAPLTRDAIGAMWDELQEEDEE